MEILKITPHCLPHGRPPDPDNGASALHCTRPALVENTAVKEVPQPKNPESIRRWDSWLEGPRFGRSRPQLRAQGEQTQGAPRPGFHAVLC